MHDTLRAATRRAFSLTLAASLGAALLGGLPVHAAPADDLGAIRHVLMHTFDRPDAPLRVDPIVVHKDQAIADWQQGDRGGRALMRRSDDQGGWEIQLCAGDGLRQTGMLVQTGMSAPDARTLSAALIQAEKRLDAATLARLASFQGTVHMGPHGAHPPIDESGHPGHSDAHGDHLHTGH